MTTWDARRRRAPVAIIAFALAAACGKGGGGARTAPAVLDCGAFAVRVERCAADFWSAYAATDRARTDAAHGDLAGHVGEVRATFEAIGLDRMCENERRVHGDLPAWTAAVGACDRQGPCTAWAGCAAPALFARPASPSSE